MSKNVIIVIILCALVVGGVVLVQRSLQENGDDVSNIVGQENIEAEGIVEESQEETQEEFTDEERLFVGGSLMCTFSSEIEGALAEGVIYVHNGQYRGDTSITYGGLGETTISFLSKDGYSHTWQHGTGEGVRVPETRDFESDIEASLQGRTIETEYGVQSYSCVDWSPNLALFELPTDVAFSEN